MIRLVLKSFWNKLRADPVEISEKYFNFANLFDKNKADRLSDQL